MTEWGDTRRILLIEPHPGLRSDLARALIGLGYEIDDYASVADFRLADGHPPYGAHVLDAAILEDEGDPQPLDLAIERTLWTTTAREGSATVELPRSVFERPGSSAIARVLVKPFSILSLERHLLDCLASEVASRSSIGDPILRTEESHFRSELDRARRWARQDVPIVIEGELGSGRRALAHTMHQWSPRQGAPCASLDRPDLEAAGPARAATRIEQALRLARGGSLMLIEPADWPDWAQRALIAGLRSPPAALRLLTIAKEPLETSVREGRLSVELQYRLDTARLRVPPLRDRPLDQLAICTAIARRIARSLGRLTPAIDDQVVGRLAADGFPGNQIGLESRLRSALIRSDETEIRIDSALASETRMTPGAPDGTASLDLKTLERDTIVRALAHWEGNRTRASESLGISVRTLRNKIRDFGLR